MILFTVGVAVQLEEPQNMTVTEGEDAVVCARLVGRANFAIGAVLRPVGVAGSAQEGVDFTGSDHSVEFPPLSTERQCVRVQTLEDRIVEREEDFEVELRLVGDNSRVSLGSMDSVNITIIDNDGK